MNEFLSTLLQAVLIAAIPVIAGAAIKGVRAVAKHLASKTDNELAKKYLKEVADAIEDAVSFTNQTYVDTLKKSDKFAEENQAEALNRSLEKATALLTADAQKFLAAAYGDLNAYLLIRIEPEVRRQKKAEPNSVAIGSVAAATAATVAQTAMAQIAAVMDDASADAPAEPDEGGETGEPEEAEPADPANPAPMEHQFYFGIPGVE